MQRILWKRRYEQPLFHSLVPNAPFLYLLKRSENRKVFRCFHVVEKGCIRNKWVKNAQTRTNCVNRLSQLFLRNSDGMKKFINHVDCFSEQKQYKKIIRHTGKVHLFSWGLKLIALSLFAPQFIVPWRYRFYYVYYFISGYCSHFIPQESTS